MAPDKPNQKRKRGRPAGASKPDEDMSIRGGEAVEEISRNENGESQLAPKRRGRPRKSDESLPEEPAAEEQPPPQEEEAPKRKGRPRKNAEIAEVDEDPVSEEPSTQPVDTSETAPRRRGRPGRTQGIEPEAGDEETGTAQAEALNSEPKKRGRKPRSQQTEETVEDASVSETGATADLAPKRRGRPARVEVEQAETTVEEAEEPAPATTKRRGRPARTQEIEPEAEPANEEVEETAETAPKKTGRRARTQRNEPEEVPAEEELEETTDTAPKRRRRPATTQEAEAEAQHPPVAETEESPNTGRKKRGRPTKSQDADPEEPEQPETRPRKRAKAAENTQVQQQPDEPKQRGRPEKKQAPTQQEDTEMRDAEPTETGGRRRRRGRPSNEESREEPTAEPEPREKDRSAKNASKSKGGLRHVVQQEEETQEEEQAPVRRGRGRKIAESAADPSPRPNQAEKRSRKGPRGSLTEISVSEAQNQATNSSRKEKQSKKKDQPQPEAEPEEPQSPQDPLSKAPYRHLAPKTLNIPRSTIRSKWTPLDQPAISTIDNLILDSYIPVLESLTGNNSTRYTQSQTILRTFANRLHNKLVKGMPFPPATIGTKTTKGVTISAQEAELNFEKVLDASSHLQRQLDPLLHSVALLKAEKEKEEAMLEQDYRNLRKLEENARAQARAWRERTKREHVLAPGRKDLTMGEYNPDEEKALEIVVKKEKQVQGSIFDGIAEEGEEELLGLAKQIGNHMESMRSNLNQIDGVVPAIQKSRAALQAVLGKYLSEEAYEGVVLG